RYHRRAVLEAFAVAHDERSRREIDVLHAQTQSLEQTQAAAVQEARDRAVGTAQLREQATHFLASQDDGQPLRAAGTGDVTEPGEIDSQHALVEEQDRGQGLRL